MWPHKQDWDHNDLVADYSYLFTQNATTAQISAITVDVNIRAIGAARTNGFGIELPVNTSNIHSIEGATLETGTDKATGHL
ncbi:MAG: LruC domain-containing protein [Barnesiella sp.]